MVTQRKPIIDIDDSPDLLDAVERAAASGKAATLRRDGKAVAEVKPLNGAPKAPPVKRKRKTGILTKDDALFRLAGKWSSAEPTDASRKKEYLAEAYSKHLK